MEDSKITKRTKFLILDSFLQLLRLKDYDSLTIQDILEEAKVSRGTFYKYFSSKEELGKEAFDSLADKMEESFQKAVSSSSERDWQLFVSIINYSKFHYNSLLKMKENSDICRILLFRSLEKIHEENEILCFSEYLLFTRLLEEKDDCTIQSAKEQLQLIQEKLEQARRIVEVS